MRALLFLLLSAGLLLLAGANGTASAESPPRDILQERAALIEACIREIRNSLKAGQHMTNNQRMMAEEQCRARAEAALHTLRLQK